MEQGFFITGTDTGVGKTWSTVALMHYFKRQGKIVVGMKPVASGCEVQDGMLRNEDALMLQEHASIDIPYDLVNPYAFELPVSPHIAAQRSGVVIEIKEIIDKFNTLKSQVDIVLVEGVGGWRVPVNETNDIEDLAKALNLPIILVVAIKLGCLNHAILTSNAIMSSGLQCAGWIATHTDPDMLAPQKNIETLQKAISYPLLGVLPYLQAADFELFSDNLLLKC